jgi:hypothetical protein
MEVRFRVDVPLSLSLKNKKKIDSNQEPCNLCVCVCLYVPYTVDAQLRIFLLMASISAGVGGYSLCLFLLFFPLLLPTFFDISWTFFPFFSFSFLLSFRLISCRLVGCLVSYSLSPILICVSLFLFTVFFKYDVFRMLCYWFLYVFFLLLPRFFIIFPSDLSVGSLAHLISQFFGWLTPPARHTLHPPFTCPTIRLLLRLSSTAGYMNGYTLCLIFFHFKNFLFFVFSHHFNLFCP